MQGSRREGSGPDPWPAGLLTQLLTSWREGDDRSRGEFLELVYPRLRQIASTLVSNERRKLTLETGDLVHEMFLKLESSSVPAWKGRRHFFLIAGRLMRQVLVERSRRRLSQKRGCDPVVGSLEHDLVAFSAALEPIDLLSLDQLLGRLEHIEPSAARIVELRVFLGLSVDETAAALGIGRTTSTRRWRFAKAWLLEMLERGAAVGH